MTDLERIKQTIIMIDTMLDMGDDVLSPDTARALNTEGERLLSNYERLALEAEGMIITVTCG